MYVKIERPVMKDIVRRLVRYLIFMEFVDIDFDLYCDDDGTYLIRNVVSVLDVDKAVKVDQELLGTFVDLRSALDMFKVGLLEIHNEYDRRVEAKNKIKS